jgi:regulatory protein
MKETTEKEALNKLAALCSRGEHCSHDMLTKMERWGLDAEAQARVMQQLVAGRYVDDLRYAKAFALDKVRYDRWGRRKVEQALWAKHIDGDLREAALDGIADEEYVKALRPLLQSKRRSVKGGSDYERRTKLVRFALGRGFGMDIIRQCLDGEDDMDEEGFDDDSVE